VSRSEVADIERTRSRAGAAAVPIRKSVNLGRVKSRLQTRLPLAIVHASVLFIVSKPSTSDQDPD